MADFQKWFYNKKGFFSFCRVLLVFFLLSTVTLILNAVRTSSEHSQLTERSCQLVKFEWNYETVRFVQKQYISSSEFTLVTTTKSIYIEYINTHERWHICWRNWRTVTFSFLIKTHSTRPMLPFFRSYSTSSSFLLIYFFFFVSMLFSSLSVSLFRLLGLSILLEINRALMFPARKYR